MSNLEKLFTVFCKPVIIDFDSQTGPVGQMDKSLGVYIDGLG